MEKVMSYLYHGTIPPPNEGKSKVLMSLMSNAAKLQIKDLQQESADNLEKDINDNNVFEITLMAYHFRQQNLAKAAWKFMQENPNRTVKPSWYCLSDPKLVKSAHK